MIVGNASAILPFLVIIPVGTGIIKSVCRKDEIFSPSVFFSCFYLLWMGLGFAIYFFQGFHANYPIYARMAFLLLIAYFAWMIGLHFPRLRFFASTRTTPRSPELIASGYKWGIYCSLIFTILAIASIILFYAGGGLRILMGGLVEETRYAMTFGRGHLYFLGNSLTVTIPMYIGVKLYYRKKIDLFDYGLIVSSLVLISLSLSRSHLLWYLVRLVITFHYLRKQIVYRRAILYAVVVLIIAVAIVYLRYPTFGFGVRFLNEISVHIKNLGLFMINESKIGRLGLAPIIMNLSMLLPGHQPDFGIWLKELLGLTFIGGGISIPVVGEGMLSAGLAGVIAEMFIIGLILRISYHRFQKRSSLRSLFIYIILLCKCANAIGYGIAVNVISVAYELLLVFIIIPGNIYIGNNDHESLDD